MTLEMVDLEALKDAAIKKFDDHLAGGANDEGVAVTEFLAELQQIYRVVVLLQKNEPDMQQVAEIWGKMVDICDDCARRLSAAS